MFIGEYRHSVDEKGRLALPAKFRNKLADGVVITKGLEKSLVIYSLEEWGKIAPKLSSLPYTQSNARAFSRLMLSGATDCELDRQGRINIPAYLREYANLKNTTVVVGVYSRIEIWDTKEWETYKAKIEEDYAGIAENLEDLGL
jgi:MraZ protein